MLSPSGDPSDFFLKLRVEELFSAPVINVCSGQNPLTTGDEIMESRVNETSSESLWN